MKKNFRFRNSKFRKGPKTVKKWSKMTKKWKFSTKIFDFFSESIQNISRRILNRKSRFRKKFPSWKFFSGTTVFWPKWPHSENFRPKFLKFFFGIDSECFKTYSKPKKLISKKNPVENFFWDSTIFWQKWPHNENFWSKFLKHIFFQNRFRIF